MQQATPLEPDALFEDLRHLLGAEGLIVEPDRLAPFESDALSTIRGRPRALVLPRSTGELRETVRLLHRAGMPYVPRGAGTGLAGGAVAESAVLVSTARMDRILELDPFGRRARAEPGVVTAALEAEAARHGLRYLPDPASGGSCTLGGNVAANAGGPHCLKHGVTADHVLGLDVVLPGGELVSLGRGEDGGLDLAGLWIGSEGTLGIVARITVRLVPAPPAVRTALAAFDRLGDAARTVSRIIASGITPVALELMDGATIRIVEASPHASGLPADVEALLVVEVEGGLAETEFDLARVVEVARGAGAREVRTAFDPEEREDLWRTRKGAYEALGRHARDVRLQDAAVPRAVLPEVLAAIEEVSRRHEIPIVNYFHAGDGNLHPHLLFDARDPEAARRVRRAEDEIMALCVAAGGTITGEHGVGLDKRKAMHLIFSQEELQALRSVRRAVDPLELCNRGKLLPDALGPPRDDRPRSGPV